MVHYGWACAASWQMLRHASETGGGDLLEEVEDAGMRRLLLLPLLLTRHRVTQGANPVMLWRKKKEKKNRRLCCNMTSTLRSVGLSVH